MKIRIPFAIFLLVPGFALAQIAPNLGATAAFAVLGANAIPIIGTVTCTETGAPPSGIVGQVGTTFPGGITNTGCAITGPIVAGVGAGVVGDFNTAFTQMDTLNPGCTGVIPIVTTTLAPGVYCSVAGTTITGPGVTLTLNGTATDVWIFRVGTGGLGALTLTDVRVVMGGTANACNVYWKTAEAATVSAPTLLTSTFVGNVLAGTAITMTGGSWTGRALATTNVTLTDPTPFTGCPPVAAGLGPGLQDIPTLSEWAMIVLALLLGLTAFASKRRPWRASR